ncbi:MAG: hypothetical protein WA584_00460 [Pyrinomonadaceae bacterium]
MTIDFDKEIDAILRKARDGETAVAMVNQPTHLDADTLSAFAENALPENAKMRATTHLADCERCRKILSNLILLASETESEIVHADAKEVVAPAVSWYRKLFVFPNLVYSLGALVLVFGGLIAFTVLQNFNSLENATVSQMSNKPMETKSAPAAANTNSAMNVTNSMTANVQVPANSPYESNTAAPHLSMNSNVSATPGDAPIGSADEAPREATRSNNEIELAKTEASQPPVLDKKKELEENKPQKSVKDDEDDVKLNAERQMPVPSASGALTKQAPKKMTEKYDARKTGETTSVGGKTFRRANNVWYDAAYGNQPTTNITRGTSEYKKLDSGLRSIAENLGGTVVVVWKSKAYRIQ